VYGGIESWSSTHLFSIPNLLLLAEDPKLSRVCI